MALDWVTAKDPNSDNTVRVSKRAFERVWSDKGFTVVEEASDKPAPAPAPAPRPAPAPAPAPRG